VPLVLVKDIMNYMPQMKYMFANVASATSNSDPAAKRMKLSWPELLTHPYFQNFPNDTTGHYYWNFKAVSTRNSINTCYIDIVFYNESEICHFAEKVSHRL